MLRSLIAALIAAFAGLITAQLVERMALGLSIPQWAALLASWGVAAFVASSLALLIGRRWAPLGWLAAATMLLLAVVTAAGGTSWRLIPGAVIVTGAGGFLAVRLMKTRHEPPFARRDEGMFR